MLVATLMVIAVSGYAAEQFVPILTTNFDDGTKGKWQVWGNEPNPKELDIAFVNSEVDGGGLCLKLKNPSGTAFYHAQLAYDLNNNEYLSQSKKYKIKFKAKCKNGSSQLQFVYQNNPDWNIQKEVQTFNITGEWQEFETDPFKPESDKINRIIINFGQNQDEFYIDDIEFGSYETQDPGTDPGTGTTPDPTPDPTPTGSLNNTMYYDGTQWCLMLEDFEGENAVERVHIDPADGSGTVTVVDDPLKTSKKSLNFYGAFGWNTYCYIDFTLPEPKKLSESYFKNLIFDVVYNQKGTDNTYKTYKVNIDNTSTQLGQFSSGNANTASWSQQQFDLAGKYTNEKTFRIYIGGHWANTANLFIDNIRLSVTASGNCGKTTQTDAGWMFDGNTLYISGTGDIADYTKSNQIPWNDNKANISNIIIGEGITAIGKNNFYDHKAITSISLPSTLKKIGEQAFYASSSETNLAIDLIIPEGVTSIGSNAFYSRNGLKSVVLPSTLQEIGSQGLYVNNGNTPIPFTFHSNPTLGDKALYRNSTSYTATLVLDDALSPYFEATSANTFNGGIHYKRTLSAQYSTITLPFKPTSGLENCTFYQLSAKTKDALIFDKVKNTELVAGKPYIVKTEGQTPAEIDFSTDESIEIPANAAAGTIELGSWVPGWTMHGTYELVKESENSEYDAYGFTGNELKRNTGNMTVKPFRAYFTTPKDYNTTAKDYLNVIFGGEVTGIERNEFSPEGITEIFSLDGKKHDCLQKGMNIVKMNNGSIKKIVIK